MRPSLREMQESFQRYLLRGDPEMLEQVVEDALCNRKERLGVYGSAYRLRLMEALEFNYPGLHTLLGDTEFHKAGHAYIDRYPSHEPSIRWFGDRLADFLGKQKPWSEESMLAEMAEFEWTRCAVFDAPDQPPVTEADLARIAPDAWPTLRFTPHPSLRRLDLNWNTPVFRGAVDEEKTPEAPQKGAYPIGWVLWRKGIDSFWRSMEVDEAVALDALIAGEDFSALCGLLLEWIDEENVALRAAGMLKLWVNEGMIGEIIAR